MKALIGGKSTDVTVQRKNIKNMYLRVKEDGSLLVTCRYGITDTEILNFLYSREAWILNSLLKQKQKQSLHEEGTDGPVIYWLGEKKYARYVAGSRESVNLDGDIITFVLKEETEERIRRLFRRAGAGKLMEMIGDYRTQWDEKICDRHSIPRPQIAIKYMTSRWGVCYPSRQRISLSTRLIHYPAVCTQAVLLHEYVHFLVPNHSSEFYGIVHSFMPEYSVYDRMLK